MALTHPFVSGHHTPDWPYDMGCVGEIPERYVTKVSLAIPDWVKDCCFVGDDVWWESGWPDGTPGVILIDGWAEACEDIMPVTSVGLDMPPEFAVANSPIVGSGTFVVTKEQQVENTFYCGPESGGSGVPTFRLIVLADLPGGYPAPAIGSGALPAGVTIPGDQVTSGALGSGVTIPGTQVTSGALGSGVTIPATQLTSGTIPSGIDIPYSQVTGAPAAGAPAFQNCLARGSATSRRFYVCGVAQMTNGFTTLASITAGDLWALPIPGLLGGTLVRVGVFANPGVGMNGRIGLYSAGSTPGDLYPSALVQDFGVLSITAGSGQKILTVSQSLTAGVLYYIGIILDTSGNKIVGCQNAVLAPNWGLPDGSLTNTPGFAFVKTGVGYGAMPSPFPASATEATNSTNTSALFVSFD